MRIFEIIPNLSSGGAERFTVDLCNELSGRGHEVTLICLFDIDRHDGMDFYLPQVDKRIRIIQLDKKFGFDKKLFGKLTRLIRKERPDVVHSHLRALMYLMPIYFRNSGIRFVHTVHNDARKEAEDKLNIFCRKLAFRSGRCLAVTISEESDRSFVDFYGAKANRVLIANGSPKFEIDPKCATELIEAKTANKTVIVNVARLEPQKNQLELAIAARKFPEVEFFNIGNDTSDYAREVKAIAPANFHILGQRTNPRDYMAAADAFILSSVFEGMPITLIESFAVGCIPIVTPAGGVKNMVRDGFNGIVAKTPEAHAIADAIRRFIALDNNQRAKMCQKAAESYTPYSISRCAEEYVNIFERNGD